MIRRPQHKVILTGEDGEELPGRKDEDDDEDGYDGHDMGRQYLSPLPEITDDDDNSRVPTLTKHKTKFAKRLATPINNDAEPTPPPKKKAKKALNSSDETRKAPVKRNPTCEKRANGF